MNPEERIAAGRKYYIDQRGYYRHGVRGKKKGDRRVDGTKMSEEAKKKADAYQKKKREQWLVDNLEEATKEAEPFKKITN